MADNKVGENAGSGEMPVTILSHEGAGLSPETFRELQEKYGLQVRLRTDKPGLDAIMRTAEDAAGYDRTLPDGYLRYYDKS